MTHLRAATDVGAGYQSVDELVEYAKAGGHESVAMLNESLFGVPRFIRAAESAGINPVVGVSLKVDAGEQGAVGTMAVYPQNAAGYANLCDLVSEASRAGAVDLLALCDRAQGLALLDGGAAGPLDASAWDTAPGRQLRSAFEGRLGLEISRVGDGRDDEEIARNQALARSSRQLRLPLVATHPCEYGLAAHAVGARVLKAVKRGVPLKAVGAGEAAGREMPTMDDMARRFSDIPQALANADGFARAAAFKPELGGMALPDLGGEPDADLIAKAQAGLLRRLGDGVTDAHKARLAHELGIIQRMGFSSYFLIVADYVAWAKAQGIGVGSGRGSAVGSLVAYALGITGVDPLQHGLIFERFLNPERVSPPDIDVDFAPRDRMRVLRHVADTYGAERVAQVATVTTCAGKSAVRDAARVLEMPIQAANRLAGIVDESEGLKAAIRSAHNQGLARDERVRAVLSAAALLVGRVRQTGTHPGAVVVSPQAMNGYLPVQPGSQAGGIPVVQGDGADVEALGLVKLDLLGLNGLDARDLAVRAAKLDIDSIPLDDPEAMAVFARGETGSVFQFSGEAMQRYLKDLKPTRFSDLVVMTSLYRPGPMEYIRNFIRRSQGKEAVSSPHEALGPMLEETKGIIVYQEQVMQVAMELAGMSAGEADTMRRAMGKKKPEVMEAQREIFVNGAVGKGVEAGEASRLFDVLAKFSGYGFNKSHAVAYALLGYQDAYLAAHHPDAFIAGKLSSAEGDPVKVGMHLRTARRIGVSLRRPSVNGSGLDYEADDGGVRIGFLGIRGIGAKGAKAIVAEREAKGRFLGLEDFLSRVGPNKAVRTALLESGAFDDFGAREDMASALASERADLVAGGGGGLSRWARLQGEVRTLGAFVSGHLFDGMAGLRELVKCGSVAESVAQSGGEVRLCGVVMEAKKEVQRKVRRIVASIDDGTGMVMATLDEQALKGRMEGLAPGVAVVVSGELKDAGGELAVRGTDCQLLDVALRDGARWASVKCFDRIDREAVKGLLAKAQAGPCRVSVDGDASWDVSLSVELFCHLAEWATAEVRASRPEGAVQSRGSENPKPGRMNLLTQARAEYAKAAGALEELLSPKVRERAAPEAPGPG